MKRIAIFVASALVTTGWLAGIGRKMRLAWMSCWNLIQQGQARDNAEAREREARFNAGS